MAHTETPVAAERIAVLEAREFPGRASMIVWARFFGSSGVRFDSCLYWERAVAEGRIRGVRVGRSLVASIFLVSVLLGRRVSKLDRSVATY